MIFRSIEGVFERLIGERRAATALIIAFMSIPLITAAGAALDFSRISAARAQLQASADNAAVAGAGAYQTNTDGTIAYNTAKTAFTVAEASLNSYATVTYTVGSLCNPAGASGITCGTTSSSNGTTSKCPSTTYYCVEVTAQATLRNSLLGFLIPTDVLNVTAWAQTTGIPIVSSGSFTHSSIGYGSDLDALYAADVPQDAAGNPQYGSSATPNSNCNNSSYGPIQYVASSSSNGSSSCNYVLIGENSGSSGVGSISDASSDPIGFTYVNFTGGNVTSGTTTPDTTTFNILNGVTTNNGASYPTHYFSELYVTLLGVTTYLPYGETLGGVILYGYCPAHNLYGSIYVYPNATNDIVPYADSVNVYHSTWTMLGYPPTHGTNHAILPFLGPANTLSIVGVGLVTIHAICPQWPTAYTQIVATSSFSPSNLPAGYSPVTNQSGNFPTATNVPVFSTFYPDVQYTGSNGLFPPVIAGCTPATNATDGGETPVADNPWWGWSPANNTHLDPGGASENPGGGGVTNCTSTKLNSGATGITTTQNVTQSSIYNNCTFLIQPLGTSVPMTNNLPNLPDYYTYNVTPTAFAAGTTGNANNVVSSQTSPLYGITPIYDGTSNSKASGYVPTSISVSGTGPYTVTEPPSYSTDGFPPEDTSHQCYNPQANGINGTLLPSADQPNNDSPVTPIDPVENPEYGAVYCNANPPQNYVMFWNDMGSWIDYYNDDLGYDNAVTLFTCPTPGVSGGTGPPTLGG
jgi:Flp pilus assembly protein TadG